MHPNYPNLMLTVPVCISFWAALTGLFLFILRTSLNQMKLALQIKKEGRKGADEYMGHQHPASLHICVMPLQLWNTQTRRPQKPKLIMNANSWIIHGTSNSFIWGVLIYSASKICSSLSISLHKKSKIWVPCKPSTCTLTGFIRSVCYAPVLVEQVTHTGCGNYIILAYTFGIIAIRYF